MGKPTIEPGTDYVVIERRLLGEVLVLLEDECKSQRARALYDELQSRFTQQPVES